MTNLRWGVREGKNSKSAQDVKVEHPAGWMRGKMERETEGKTVWGRGAWWLSRFAISLQLRG